MSAGPRRSAHRVGLVRTWFESGPAPRRRGHDRQSFTARGVSEPLIERDKRHRLSELALQVEAARELHGVASPQTVAEKERPGASKGRLTLSRNAHENPTGSPCVGRVCPWRMVRPLHRHAAVDANNSGFQGDANMTGMLRGRITIARVAKQVALGATLALAAVAWPIFRSQNGNAGL